jgi:serine/threonine-protein kinase RsbW
VIKIYAYFVDGTIISMSVDVPIQKKVELASEMCLVEKFCQKLVADASQQGFCQDDTFGIHMALQEAMINAIKHGNAGDPNKKLIIEYLITQEIFDATITDQGCGFVPDDVPDPRDEENLHKMNGRGILLIRTYMDIVEYNKTGNQIHISKRNKNTAKQQMK